MKYIVAVDLEGIHGVVGRAGEKLRRGLDTHAEAAENAVKEINALCEALFAAGETEVLLWDNHGLGDNLDYEKLKGNVTIADWRKYPYRMEFLKEHDCKGIFYLGYHAKAGTLGVLSHTYSSSDVQYYKFNGKAVGEFEIDSMLAAEYGIAPYFAAADDVATAQMQAFCPHLTCVTTKIAKGRNQAELFGAEAVLAAIQAGAKKALQQTHTPTKVQFPLQAEFRFSTVEMACDWKHNLENVLTNGVEFGEDCNVVKATLLNFAELKTFLRGRAF